MSRLGEKIRTTRMEKGITQKQLAKAVGVTEKVIVEIETGKRVINEELIKKISKALVQEISEVMVYNTEEKDEQPQPKKDVKPPLKAVEQKPQDVWSEAFELLMKAVPIYDYTLSKSKGTRQLPVVSNKVEGHARDKVLYLELQDNDMIGFRMIKGDIAFGYVTHEVENNAICLIEYNNQRAVRQIKRIDSSKVLLVSNKGSLVTETVSVKDIKVLARLERLEIKL